MAAVAGNHNPDRGGTSLPTAVLACPQRIVLITRKGCHLCDLAAAVIEEVSTEKAIDWASLDVDDDPQLRSRYTDHVPVVFVDGELGAYWTLDRDQLIGLLDPTSGWPRPATL